MTREERWQEVVRGGAGGYVYGGRVSLGRFVLHIVLLAAMIGLPVASLEEGDAPLLVIGGLMLLAVVGNYVFQRRSRVVVEADRVGVDRPLQSAAFVGWSEVAGVLIDRGGARLIASAGPGRRAIPLRLGGTHGEGTRALIEHIAERAGLEEITGRPELIRRLMPEAKWPVQAAWWRVDGLTE